MILDRVRRVFTEVFDDPTLRVDEGTTAADIADWDSVAQVKLVLAIEEEFGVRLSTDEVLAFQHVGDVVRSLNKKTGRQ